MQNEHENSNFLSVYLRARIQFPELDARLRLLGHLLAQVD
jgi:hypothetical protein